MTEIKPEGASSGNNKIIAEFFGYISRQSRYLAPLILMMLSGSTPQRSPRQVDINAVTAQSTFYSEGEPLPELQELAQYYAFQEDLIRAGVVDLGNGYVDYGVNYKLFQLPEEPQDEGRQYLLLLHHGGYTLSGSESSSFSNRTFRYEKKDVPLGLLVTVSIDGVPDPTVSVTGGNYFDSSKGEYFWFFDSESGKPIILCHDVTFQPYNLLSGITTQKVTAIHTENDIISLQTTSPGP